MRILLCLFGVLLTLPGTSWPHNGTIAYVWPLSGITIDGGASDWPDSLVRHPITHLASPQQAVDPLDLSASFRAGFDPAAGILYILVEVEDDTLIVDGDGMRRRSGADGCSVVLDIQHGDRTPARQFSIFGTKRFANSRTGKRNDWTGVEVGVIRTKSTHVYEWMFDLNALGSDVPQQTGTLSFDIEIFDIDTRERRRPTLLSWGKGQGKLSTAQHRADLLLVPGGESMHDVSGMSGWSGHADRGPERVTFVAAEGWRLTVGTQDSGAFAASLPRSTYRVWSDDYWMASKDTVSIDLTVEDVNDLHLTGLKVVAHDYYEDSRSLSTDSVQRGVSWVASTEETSERELIHLVENNVEWIVQTPFGWQSKHNGPPIRMNTHAGWWGESDQGLRETTRLARKYGLRTLLKPHLWLNRSGGKWRGDIGMDTEADWITWFENYSTFIIHYARLAEELEIEALCVGLELHRTAVERESDWRRVISQIRSVYDWKLVYGANWHEEFEQIRFWDALDYIGIQAYFPLTKRSTPTVEELVLGWAPHVQAIERIQKSYGKPVLITELGYHSSVDAAIEPWTWRVEADDASPQDRLQTQANCYEAFFRSFWDKPWFSGVYIWKWYPQHASCGGTFDTDFTPQNKPAERVMASWYGRPRQTSD